MADYSISNNLYDTSTDDDEEKRRRLEFLKNKAKITKQDVEEISKLKEIGDYAKSIDMRLSFHPTHFCIPASENPVVVKNDSRLLLIFNPCLADAVDSKNVGYCKSTT